MDAVFSRRKKEDFEKMAEEDSYINEAYEVLQKLSADERKRLEYEARQKAIRDYNSQMSSSFAKGIQVGEERGEKIGEERGIQKGTKRLNCLYEKLLKDGRVTDLQKAVSDAVYREKLCEEYKI